MTFRSSPWKSGAIPTRIRRRVISSWDIDCANKSSISLAWAALCKTITPMVLSLYAGSIRHFWICLTISKASTLFVKVEDEPSVKAPSTLVVRNGGSLSEPNCLNGISGASE